MSDIINNNQGVSLEEDIYKDTTEDYIELCRLITPKSNKEHKIEYSLMYEWLDPNVYVDFFINSFDKETINKLKEEIAELQKAARKVK